MAELRLDARGVSLPPLTNVQGIQGVGKSEMPAQNLDMIARSTAQEAARLQESSEKLYLAEFQKNARESIDEISKRNASDPNQMQMDLDSFEKGYLKNAPMQLRGIAQEQFAVMSRPAINNAVRLRTQINNDKLKETNLTNINEAFKNLESNAAGMLSDDPHAAYDASRSVQLQMMSIQESLQTLTEDGTPLFGAEQRVRMLEQSKQQMVQSGVLGWFDGEQNKIKAYEDFTSGKKQFKFYDAQGNVEVVLDPIREMNRGTFEKVRNYMERDVQKNISQIQQAQQIANFESMINDSRMLIDPQDKGQRAMANSFFENKIIPQIANKSPEERNDSIAQYVSRVGIIPSQVQGLLRASMRNGSVKNQAEAADLISKIQETTPQALSELNGKDVNYSLMLTKSMRGGLNPEEAVSQTKTLFDPLKEDVISRRRSDFKAIKIDSESELKSAFSKRGWSSLFFNQTKMPTDLGSYDRARSDYLTEYENQYLQTGDADIAKARAQEIISRQYGVTEVTGKTRITKYPPENYYAVNGLDNAWMKEQLKSDVTNFIGEDVDLNDIALVPDAQTAREVGANENPGYTVSVKNKNGEYVPLRSGSNLMRFYFDSSKAVNDHNEQVKIDNEKAVADSKAEYERLRSKRMQDIERLKMMLPPMPQEKL